MDITEIIVDNECVLVPHGQINALTSEELEAKITECAKACEKITLDMSEVDYVSSAGIRVVIKVHRAIGGENFHLKNVSRNVMELFEMTGFAKMLNIEQA